jgi:major membrane immunogen (membrane-anchored lipoprotein)
MKKLIYLLIIFSVFLTGCSTTDSTAKDGSSPGQYQDGSTNGLVIDNTKYSYVDEASFGKKIIPDGNVILHRENFHIANMYPTYMAIYKKVNDEGYYLDKYNSTCEVYGKFSSNTVFRDNFEPGEYCIVITCQDQPYDYFNAFFNVNAAAIVLYVGDEYKAKQDEFKSKNAFKIDDTGVDTEFVFLGDDEILDVSIDYTTAKLFVRKYDLKTKIYKK